MELSTEEWDELVALKEAINYNPASVHPMKMELFTELLVRSWEGKGDDRTFDKYSKVFLYLNDFGSK